MPTLTTKDLFGLPPGPREKLRLKLIALEAAAGTDGRVAVHKVRGRITTNVANLAVFTVAGNDGLTYAEGERIYLDGQSTGAQKGIYVVGVVGGGTAALTRAADWAAADTIPTGTLIAVDAGTANGNQVLMISNAGDVLVGTTTPALLAIIDDTRFHATVVPNANVVGGIPVVHRILIASGANGDTDVVLTNKTRVIDATIVLKGAGTAGCLVTIKNGANAISDAVNVASG